MRQNYCEAALERSLRSIQSLTEEVNTELQGIKDRAECPAPCRDGTVLISPKSGQPRRMECPVATKECAYGREIAAGLDGYLLGLMAGCGVPERHRANFRQATHTLATSAARRWFGKGFLVLTGRPGVGKSFGAAYGIYLRLLQSVNHWLDRGTWSTAAKTADGIAWSSAKEIADERSTAVRARNANLLVLDDLGKEEATKTGMAAVCDVIAKRYDDKSPAIVTTELTLPDIEARYGRYLAERLVEDSLSRCGGSLIDCGHESMRLREGREKS